ncbi:MAG: hypothetical protein IPO02_10880 [Bacteroidetes bacterium]|nr:hypothetical protein [Bacteroidota bacterium]
MVALAIVMNCKWSYFLMVVVGLFMLDPSGGARQVLVNGGFLEFLV